MGKGSHGFFREHLKELENIGTVINLNLEIESFDLEVTFQTLFGKCSVRTSTGVATYPDWGFRHFLQSLQSNSRTVPLLAHFLPSRFSTTPSEVIVILIKRASISNLGNKLGRTTDRYGPKQISTKNCMDFQYHISWKSARIFV
jgi:hypothetical protein